MSHITGTATDFLDLIDILDGFLTDQGHAWGLTYSGDGNGELSNWAGGASSIAETFTITMLSDLDFDVVGSVSGHVGYGTVGITFSHAKIEFRIDEGSQPFVAGDQWTISTSPAWTLKRRNLMVEFSADKAVTGDKSFHKLTDGLIDRGALDDQFELVDADLPATVIFHHESPQAVVEYCIAIASVTLNPSAWTLEYWEESSSSWQVADTQASVSWTAGHVDTYRVFTLASTITAARWRWVITAINNGQSAVGQFALRTANGGINVLDECVVWQAPGDDNDRSFYCGIKPIYRADVDYYNLELLMMSAWADGSELSAQTGLERNNYTPLWDTSIDYWIVARGNGVRGVFKIGTQYEALSMGHIDAYFPPNEYPAPLLLGGSLARQSDGTTYEGPANTTQLRFSETGRAHSAYPIAGYITANLPGIDQINQHRSSCRIRLFDGTFRAFAAYRIAGFDDTTIFDNDGVPVPPGDILPYAGGFGQVSVGVDGTPVLFEIIVGTKTDILGELPGVKAVSGDSVSAETVIAVGPIDYIVFPNVNRTDFNEFYALALD